MTVYGSRFLYLTAGIAFSSFLFLCFWTSSGSSPYLTGRDVETLADIYHQLHKGLRNKRLSMAELHHIVEKLKPIAGVHHSVDITNTKSQHNFTLDASNVTVLLDFTHTAPPAHLLDKFLSYLKGNETKFHTLIAIPPNYTTPSVISAAGSDHPTSVISAAGSDHPKLRTIVITNNATPGSVWNELIKNHVKTELVFIGRDIIFWDEHSHIEELVKGIKSLGAKVVAGSFRYPDGHWYMGCQQHAMKNYSLVYTGGYHRSKSSCLFCSFSDAPFLTYTHVLKETTFSETLYDVTTYHDLFLTLTHIKDYDIITCPQSMFYVKHRPDDFDPKSWKTFANKWKLDHIITDMARVQIPCSEQQFGCTHKRLSDISKGVGLTPCCLQQLATEMKTLMNVSQQLGVISSVLAGNLLGALKFNGILPWELDADIFFANENDSAYKKIESADETVWKNFKIKLHANHFPSTRAYNVHRENSSWLVEWYGGLHHGGNDPSPEYYKHLGLDPTKVNIDGAWLRTVPNPGMHSLTSYQREIYQHSQHNRVHHIKYDAVYEPRMWRPCVDAAPTKHNCLEQYDVDGNIQFRDPIP